MCTQSHLASAEWEALISDKFRPADVHIELNTLHLFFEQVLSLWDFGFLCDTHLVLIMWTNFSFMTFGELCTLQSLLREKLRPVTAKLETERLISLRLTLSVEHAFSYRGTI